MFSNRLIIVSDISAAHVGLVLTQLTMFQKEFDTTLVGAVKVEAQMIAVERILEYVRQNIRVESRLNTGPNITKSSSTM
jgi:hypothetical protein